MEVLGLASLSDQKICLFSKTPGPARRPTQPPIHLAPCTLLGVKRQERDVENAPLHGTEVKVSIANPLIITYIYIYIERERERKR